jgi:hypothetical protein
MRQALMFLFILVIAIISVSMTGYALNEEGQYLHLRQMDIKFEGTDAEVTFYYELDMFSRVYVFLLGSYNLQPTIENVLFDFEQTEVRELGRNHAVVYVHNISRQNSEYYLHDSRALGAKVDTLTMIYPDGSSRSVPGATATPYTFYGG